jgi:hypothetical protein
MVLLVFGALIAMIGIFNALWYPEDLDNDDLLDGGRLYKSFVMTDNVVLCWCEGIEPMCQEVPQE